MDVVKQFYLKGRGRYIIEIVIVFKYNLISRSMGVQIEGPEPSNHRLKSV